MDFLDSFRIVSTFRKEDASAAKGVNRGTGNGAIR
jgi:hypothetical protein